MQFGIFTVGDVTPDPTNGREPTEHERIKAIVAIARKAEEVGLVVLGHRDSGSSLAVGLIVAEEAPCPPAEGIAPAVTC